MAKGYGIFLSLNVTGSLFKTLVATHWKGLNVLRGWVKPADPNTPLQQAVRTLVQLANAAWHAVQWTVADLRAWVLLASTRTSPQTGQNQFIRECLRILAVPNPIEVLFDGQSAKLPGTDVTFSAAGDAALPNVKFLWGYKPNVLLYGDTNHAFAAGRWKFQIAPGAIPPGTVLFWTVYNGNTRATADGFTGVYRWIQT